MHRPLIILSIFFFFFNSNLVAMEKKPYHHLPDGTFRNPEGSPKRNPNVKWSYKIFPVVVLHQRPYNAPQIGLRINFHQHN